MTLDFSIYEFLKRMLPRKKRQTNRMKLFWWPIRSIHNLWVAFKDWRNDVLFRTNITGQKLALEVLLNKYVDGAGGGISIIEAIDGGVWVSLDSEASDILEAGLSDEPAEAGDFVEVAIKGESGTVLEVDFRILAPIGANIDQILYLVNIYKIAGKEFDVVTN